MTREEARILVLEYALSEACATIEFLHNCLTKPHATDKHSGYVYRYPYQTVTQLGRLRPLLPPAPPTCVHSNSDPDCASCQWHTQHTARLVEAQRILAE